MNNGTTEPVSLPDGAPARESYKTGYARRKLWGALFGRGFDYRHLHHEKALAVASAFFNEIRSSERVKYACGI